MSGAALTVRQLGFTNKAFWRNPASAFFTFAFPLMFLVIFTSLLGNNTVVLNGTEVALSTYYVAGMAAFGVISACYTNLAINVSFQRDMGILKRTRGTPLPAWSYLTARVVHGMLVAFLLVVITTGFGAVAYSAHVPGGIELVEFVVALVVGAASFAALGLATTSIIPNADASPAIVNAIVLPLLFLSGVFFAIGDDAPSWIKVVGAVFPVKHFTDAMQSAYLGSLGGRGGAVVPFDWTDVLIVAAWGLGGLIVASRFFSWEPRK
jgi:ABC-2 type transport system permease protein